MDKVDLAKNYFFKGLEYMAAEEFKEAEKFFLEANRLIPNRVSVLTNLSAALLRQNKSAEAKSFCEQCIALDETNAEAWVNLGACFIEEKNYGEALSRFEKAIAIRPDYPEAWKNRGDVFCSLRHYDEALACHQKAIMLAPGYLDAWLNRGLVLYELNRLDEALLHYEKVISLRPRYSDSWWEHGKNIHIEQTYIACIAILQRLCDHSRLPLEWNALNQHLQSNGLGHEYFTPGPSIAKMLESLLLGLCYGDTYPEQTIYDYHVNWGDLVKKDNANFVSPRKQSTRDNNIIKIGYLSPDLRNHSVGFFIRHVIAAHNHNEFEIACYSLSNERDEMTEAIIQSCDHYADVGELDDADVARRIKDDDIDVLIHLAGHTAGGRMAILAYRPAPVQVMYLGYPNTSGADFVDYWITDHHAHTETDRLRTEKLLRMPESFLCFGSFESRPIKSSPPAMKSGFITFGSFNNLAKLSPSTARLWASLLTEVPKSRLVLKARDVRMLVAQQNISRIFRSHGVSEDRLTFLTAVDSRADHLETYNGIDIALDPVPYNGATTTCEALWMGVPVLTLVGQTHRQRVSYSILKNTGVEDTVALTEEEFIEIGKRLAGDLDQLEALRKRVASSIRNSILCNPEKFTRQLEAELAAVYSGHRARKSP